MTEKKCVRYSQEVIMVEVISVNPFGQVIKFPAGGQKVWQIIKCYILPLVIFSSTPLLDSNMYQPKSGNVLNLMY